MALIPPGLLPERVRTLLNSLLSGKPDLVASQTFTGNQRIVGKLTVAPGASVTPANNGDVEFQLTSNTSLTFKAKGDDGVVRSGSVTLS